MTRGTAGAIDVVVIGAGHAGLAISQVLGSRAVEHVVLERGEVANSWRNERWDSLTLLTPNWQTRLPGCAYSGDDPDGYMSVSELVRFLDDYATNTATPIVTGCEVRSVRRIGERYRLTTTRGTWHARAVVLATGACNAPTVPKGASELPSRITQLTPFDYRSPESVPDGGTLIVGASASGLQLANELQRAGRTVTLAAGEHVRMPRRYRGKDIFYWMTHCGIHDQQYNEIDDVARGRRLPSPQLIGSSDVPILDLNHLRDAGARIAGRFMRVWNDQAQFSGSLGNVCALADLKMQRLLRLIDETADQEGAPPGEAFAPTRVDDEPLLSLDLDDVQSVIWATGFRPDYSWLDVDVLDRKGHLRHDGGIVDSAGLYVLGLPLMRRRKSSFIFGIEDDALDIADHLVGYLTTRVRRAS
jgi:putative flavoprotein involved in K+ transport